MLGEILSKPFTYLLVGCLILATAFCSIMVTRLAGNYQERARCMQLANALVSYGQKNNGFSNSTIYTGNRDSTQEKNIASIVENTISVFDFSEDVKPDIKIYKGKPKDKVNSSELLYSLGNTNDSKRLNREDTFTVEVTPKYYDVKTGEIKDGTPIKAVGKAHGYIKS